MYILFPHHRHRDVFMYIRRIVALGNEIKNVVFVETLQKKRSVLICMHICIYIYECLCVYILIYIYIYMCVCVCVCVRVCMCVYTYMCVCV